MRGLSRLAAFSMVITISLLVYSSCGSGDGAGSIPKVFYPDGPKLQTASFSDVDNSDDVSEGDYIILNFNTRMAKLSTVTTLMFELPVTGDSFGINSTTVYPYDLGLYELDNNNIIIVLGSSAAITPAGAYRGSDTDLGSPSGITVKYYKTSPFLFEYGDATLGAEKKTVDIGGDTPATPGAPVATVTTPSGTQSGDVTITYALYDNESDTCSIQAQYSTNGGFSFSTATQGSGGDGTSGLSSSPAGVVHTYVWASATDLADCSTSVIFRITPSDSGVGTPGQTGAFLVDNTTPAGNGAEVYTYTTNLSGPRTLALGYIDSDNYLDAVVVNNSVNTFVVYLNDGTGQMTHYGATLTASTSGRGVIIGDFNGDSVRDVALGFYSTASVVNYMGFGTGAFSSGLTFNLPGYCYSLDGADLTGDMVMDAVASFYNSSIGSGLQVMQCTGVGGFINAGILSTATYNYRTALADLNSAGGADIICPYMTGANYALLYWNNGAGVFTDSPTVVTTAPYVSYAVAGNFTSSGTDFVTLSPTTDQFLLHDGNGSGSFTNGSTVSVTVNSTYVDMGAGDFNGDGDLDLAVLNSDNNRVDVYYGDGNGAFGSASSIDLGYGTLRRIEVGDLNNDGTDDMAVVSYSFDRLIIVICE